MTDQPSANDPTPSSSSDEEGECCRFCGDELSGDPSDLERGESSYFRPCKCNSFVHHHCLNRWLTEKTGSIKKCEVCKYQFEVNRQFAGWSAVGKKCSQWMFICGWVVLYWLLPHLWRLDSWFGILIISPDDRSEYRSEIYDDWRIGTILLMIFGSAFHLFSTFFFSLIPYKLYLGYSTDVDNSSTLWKFLTKNWLTINITASLPVIHVIISHVVGYLFVHFYLKDIFLTKMNQDLLAGTSYFTFVWGNLFVIAGLLSLIIVILVISGIAITSLYLANFLFCFLPNYCCFSTQVEIKPYKTELDDTA